MIVVEFMCQFGNQLFQYNIGRILAQRTGQAFQPPVQWLDKHGWPVVWTLKPPLVTPRAVPGEHPSGDAQTVHVEQWLDLDSVRPDRPVHITYGYFQRYELLQPYKDQIRNDWLKLSQPFVQTDSEAVYVHVRRTDYVGGWATSIDDYAKCLDCFPDAKRLVLVTDDPEDPIHNEFSRFGLPYTISGRPWDKDFLLLASCRQLIISQSTFAWWAGFLGQAEKIVCPVFPGTFWRHGVGITGHRPPSRDYPNLYVYDEPERWHWLT